MNIIARLEFELAYFDPIIQRFYHGTSFEEKNWEKKRKLKENKKSNSKIGEKNEKKIKQESQDMGKY